MKMKRLILWAVACAVLAQPLSSAEKSKESETMANMPKVGDLAPEFKLKYFDGNGPPKDITLSQYRGQKQVILAFYVFAFTGG
jgi:Ni/Co efflux regulator RcnB